MHVEMRSPSNLFMNMNGNQKDEVFVFNIVNIYEESGPFLGRPLPTHTATPRAEDDVIRNPRRYNPGRKYKERVPLNNILHQYSHQKH